MAHVTAWRSLERVREPRTQPVETLNVVHRKGTRAARTREVNKSDRPAASADHGIQNPTGIERRLDFAVKGAFQVSTPLAQRIGLEIPPTLMTNDVEEARAFWHRRKGKVIYKQFIALPDAWRETRRLKPEDETHAASIAHAPVIFQKHVAAVADLRVTAVGGVFYAAATDVRDADYPQDVRMNLDAKYAAHELPPAITAKLSALMERLGLVYGAIDLRLTPEGRYVFLEINPARQFLYIEHATGQPIAAALAQMLLKKNAVQGRAAFVPSIERRAIEAPMPVNV